MDFDLDKSLAVLRRTPRVLSELLDGLDEGWTSCRESVDSWSPYDVVGHLIYGEQTDWLPRLKIILGQAAARTFEPFDRTAMFAASQGKTMTELLGEFTRLREANLTELDSFAIRPVQYQLTGVHPEFGEVTLAQLLATWTAHDLGHLCQIARTMARQYDQAVGPWKAYLGVLQERPI